MVERQNPDNFHRFLTQEICAWKLAAYIFNFGGNEKYHQPRLNWQWSPPRHVNSAYKLLGPES